MSSSFDRPPRARKKASRILPLNRRVAVRRLFIEALEERSLMNVDWRNPSDALDVNNDHIIAADDVVTLINDINASTSRALPDEHPPDSTFLDTNGDQYIAADDVVTIINAINAGLGSTGQRELKESGRLSTEKSVTITFGQQQGSRTYRAKIDAQFDTTDQQTALEDVLNVFLVLPNNSFEGGEKIFSLVGSQAEYEAGLVRWDGSVMEVDLTKSDLWSGSIDTATLRFQLLSSDADLGTKITIAPLSNEVLAVEPSDLSFPSQANFVEAAGPLNLASLTTSPNIEVLVENVRLDPITLRYKADMRLKNNGAAVGRDVAAIFRGLFQVPGILIVAMEGQSGFSSDKQFPEPYLNFHNAIPRGGLAHGMTSAPITVTFFDPQQVTFFLRPEIKASTNHAPTFGALGPFNVMPGSVLSVPLAATDADGDTLTYSLQPNGALPTGELTADNQLIFRPKPTELGTYTFNVIASDGVLQTSRSVTVNVVTDANTTTRVSGKILQTSGQPLSNVRIDIGAVQVLTAADGSFTANLGSGPVVSDTIKVRGELIAGATTYPFIAEKLAFVLEHDVYEHYNNVIVRPIYLPGLDTANAKQINPNQDTLVTTDKIPGASVMVKAGTLMNQQGTPFTGKLSITEVPSDLTPAAIPEGFSVDLVVTIQPGEMAFATPAPLSLPNRNGYAPGVRFELWSINPVTGEFDSVGMGQVSPDGSTIDTISGGIRNSSWHFLVVPDVAPQDKNPRNQDPGCNECKKTKGLTSEVELHSGELIETHNLVTYQADGAARGLTLNYDSLRADPRPIITFGTDDIPEVYRIMTGQPIPTPDDEARYVASVSIEEGSFSYQIPGYTGIIRGLYGGEHFWTYNSTSQVQASLQADLRSFPSGIFNYRVEAGFIHGNEAGFTGTRRVSRAEVINVNSINSPFGAGWGLAGLQSIVVGQTGSVLLIDGDGSEVRFSAGPNGTYVASPGDFTKLEKVSGLFRVTTTDKSVYQFNIDNQLATVTDKNGNVTTYEYLNKLLTGITDSVGLKTTFAYTNGRVTTITDPADRITTLVYDAAGNLKSITDPDGSHRNWDYDVDHHIIEEIDQLGRRETTEYGFHGRAIGGIRKDGSHIQISPVQTQGLLPPSLTVDPINSPASVDLNKMSAFYLDGNGTISSTPLDGRGQALAEQDKFGLLPSVARDDASNLPVASTDGRGNMALMAYDAQGNLIKQLDSLSGGGGGQTIGEISNLGEEDRYTFAGHAGQRLFIDGIRDLNIGLQIYDALGNYIGGRSYYPAFTPYLSRIMVLPHDGMYTVSVKYGHDVSDPFPPSPPTGSYRFRLVDIDDAPRLPLGTALVGMAKEAQWFKVEAERGQTLKLTNQLGAFSGSVQTLVFDPDGAKLDFPSFNGNTTEYLMATTGTYFVLIEPYQIDKLSRYQYLATLTDPDPITKVGLDVDITGKFSTGPNVFSFAAPAGTPVLFYWFKDGGHAVSIPNPTAYEPLLEYGLGTPPRGSSPFVVPRSGTYSVSVYPTFPGYSGETDEFAFRLLDLSAAPLKTVGSTISGTLAEPGRTVVYRFQGQANQLIDFGAPQSGISVTVTNGSSFSFYAAAQGIVRLPQSGEYSVIVQRDYSSAGAINFTVPLHEVTSFTPITLDTAISGQLTPGSGKRYFEISVNQGDEIYFDDLGSSDKIRVVTQGLDGLQSFSFNQATLAANEGRFTAFRGGKTYLFLDADEADRPVSYNFKFRSPTINTTSLALGQTVQSTFTEPIQTNVYTFNATAGQKLYFDRIGSTPLNLDMKVIGPAGDLTEYEAVDLSDGPSFALIALPQTGTYRFELYNRTSDTGSFSFRFSDVAAVAPITPGIPQSGTLNPGSEIDLYRVAATAGQRLTLANTVGENDAFYKLFYPNGDPLFALGNPATIPIFQSGDYTIAVYNGHFDDNPVAYSFTATLASDPPITPNNLDHTYSGTGEGSEMTVGSFTANAGTLLFLDAQSGSGTLNIYDANNNLVLQYPGTFATTSLHDGFIVLPAASTYTVKAQVFGDFAFRLRPADTAPLVSIDQNIFVPQSGQNVTDLYRVTVAVGQTIQLDSTAGGNEVTYKLRPASSEFSSIFSNNVEGFYPATAVVTGTYYLTVTRQYSPGDYGFQIHDVDAAPLIAFDQAETGVADPVSQVVIRRFDGVAGQQVLLRSNGGAWHFFDPRHKNFSGTASEGVVTLPATGVYTLERDDTYSTPTPEFSVTLTVLDDSIQPIVPAYLAAADTSTTYDPNFSQPTTVTNELGHQTLYDIDPANGNTRSVTHVVGAVGGNDDQVTSMTYLTSGLVDTVTDPLGRVTDYDYDTKRRLITVTSAKGTASQTVVHYEYDAAGNVSAYVDENNHRTTFEYDALNRLKKITQPDPDGVGPLTSPITTFTYDAVGNQLTITDANGRVTSMAYDALDRVKSMTDPGNNTTKIAYDGAGNLLSETDPLNHITQFTYDLRNRVISSVDAAGKPTNYEYDESDNLIGITDASGNKTTFEYDARDRLITRTDPLGKATKYTYDANDNLLTTIDRLGRKIEYTYDDLDRLVKAVWRNADRSIANTINYTYDKADNLLTAQDNFSTIQFAYDDLDRVTQVQSSGPSGIPSATLAYAYDAAGNMLSLGDTINGVAGGTNAYTYDALDRPTRIIQSGIGAATKRVDMQFNAIGQTTSLARFADAAGASAVATSSFVYDTLNRLSSITHKNPANSVLDSFTYQYDTASRITRITDIDGATDYTYDNRDELTAANHADAANPDESYLYDATGNRLNATTALSSGAYTTGPNNRLLSDGKYQYSYDNEGNLTKRTQIVGGAVREFAYDHRNRLVQVTDRSAANAVATQIVKYTYDALDRRIAKNVDTTPTDGQDGIVTTFIYDGDDVLVEYRDPDGSGPAAAVKSMRYLHGPTVDQILAQENAAGTVQWSLTDHLGTIHDLVNSSGQVVDHLKYDSYGNVISETNPAITTRYRFTGREFDSESDLMYYRARYYDAAIGRFINEDPIEFTGGDTNLYRYVENGPNTFIDADGNRPMARILGPAAAWTVILYVAEPYIEQAAKNISELLKKTRASMGGHAEVLRSQMAGDEERLAQNPKTPRQVAHERACDKLRRKINNLDSTLKTYRAQRDNLKKTRDRENWIRNKFGYKNLPPSKKITALNQRIEAQLGLKDRAQQQLKALDPSYNY